MKSTISLFLSILCFAQLANAAQRVAPTLSFPAPPRLATSAAEWKAAQAAPGFEAKKHAAIRAGDALLTKPITLPDGYASWIFYYACPDDGSTLIPLSLTEHQCPVCRRIYSDPRTIAAYRAKLHYAAERASEALGWAYLYSGDEKYVPEEKRILLKLAHDYPNYPQRQDRWGFTGRLARLGGRRYVQSLDEAVGIIKLAKGYDLTRNSSAWTPAEKKLVEDNLFGLTQETLLQFNQGINNHQTWYNAGLMAIASARGDGALVKKVLEMPGGFYDQLENSIGRDGLWNEGTMAYHGYALQAMMSIVDTGMRLGLPLQNEPKVRAMIDAPLNAAYPNGVFPAINDSDPFSLANFRGYFAWAKSTYSDDRYDNPQPSTTSIDLPDAGLAILRQGKGAGAVCAFLDYGPHGGGHGHFDKLNITLYANGREWLLDPGRLSYSHKEYKTWVKETVAHNTVVRGETSQQATTGKLLYFQNEKNFTACSAQSDAAYDGVLLTRTLLLAPNFLLDVYDVKANEKAPLDWMAHAIVDTISPVEKIGDGAPSTLPQYAGYQHLLEPRAWQMKGTSRWDCLPSAPKTDAPFLRMWLVNDEPEQIVTAMGIGYNINQKAPALIRRRNAASTQFVTVYDLSGNGEYIQKIGAQPNGKYRIETKEGVWNVTLTPTGANAKLAGG